jgi:valyl-tRNA synthetase
LQVLETTLRLLHPYMPFITEEIWQTVGPIAGKAGPTIMLQPYPEGGEKGVDSVANADIEWLKRVIVGIRNIRGEMNIPPGKELSVLLRNGDQRDRELLEQNAQFLKKMAKLADIAWLATGVEGPVAATALVGELEILVPMAGLIDKDAELLRLAREIQKLEKELARIRAKLGNAEFVARAPADIVAREQEKIQAQQQALTTLREQERHIRQM